MTSAGVVLAETVGLKNSHLSLLGHTRHTRHAGHTATNPQVTPLLPDLSGTLAADLTYALQVGPDALVLDAHLKPLFEDSGIEGLADMTHINQAIGILIRRGHTVEGASTELHRCERAAETTVRVAAHQLIRAASRRPGLEQA